MLVLARSTGFVIRASGPHFDNDRLGPPKSSNGPTLVNGAVDADADSAGVATASNGGERARAMAERVHRLVEATASQVDGLLEDKVRVPFERCAPPGLVSSKGDGSTPRCGRSFVCPDDFVIRSSFVDMFTFSWTHADTGLGRSSLPAYSTEPIRADDYARCVRARAYAQLTRADERYILVVIHEPPK